MGKTQLIQTNESNFIYGDFRGEENQMLFQCPRQLEDDLKKYINRERLLVNPVDSEIPFVDDNTEDCRKVEGKEMIAYWRSYWRDGYWYGRWLHENKDTPDKIDCVGVNRILDWFYKKFPNGCDWHMEDYFKEHFKGYCGDNRFLIKPFMSEYYKVMVDTTYGNGDYPVRIYVYKDIEE